jgi:hypothetical protein
MNTHHGFKDNISLGQDSIQIQTLSEEMNETNV